MYEKCEIEDMLKKYLKSKSQLEELESKIEKNKVLLKRFINRRLNKKRTYNFS